VGRGRRLLRHFLRGKFGPVSASLHPLRVQPSAPWRALEPSASAPDLLGSALDRALPTAVTLTAITASAQGHLHLAGRAQAIENPIPLVDHQRPACQFLDKRREASDTPTPSRDHAAPLKARTAIRAFAFSGAQRCIQTGLTWPRTAPDSGAQARSAPELRGSSEPSTCPVGRAQGSVRGPSDRELAALSELPCWLRPRQRTWPFGLRPGSSFRVPCWLRPRQQP
jgi:hypothetical protein